MAHVSRNVFRRVIAADPYLIDGDFLRSSSARHWTTCSRRPTSSAAHPTSTTKRAPWWAQADRVDAARRAARQHVARRGSSTSTRRWWRWNGRARRTRAGRAAEGAGRARSAGAAWPSARDPDAARSVIFGRGGKGDRGTRPRRICASWLARGRLDYAVVGMRASPRKITLSRRRPAAARAANTTKRARRSANGCGDHFRGAEVFRVQRRSSAASTSTSPTASSACSSVHPAAASRRCC